MKLLCPAGGWEQEQVRLHEIEDRVRFFEGILTPELASLAGNQLEEARVSAVRNNLRDSSSLLYVPKDDVRLMRIQWDCSSDIGSDEQLAADVEELTGVDVFIALCAARVLVAQSCYVSTIWLTYYRTAGGNLQMHRDGEKEARENGEVWTPDAGFIRDILHLDDKRVVLFAEEEDGVPVKVELDSGDAYSLRPKAIFHDAHYSRGSKALYVQGYV